MITNMVVEIPSITTERYKSKSTVYINILTNKVDILNDEEGNVVSYSTVNVPVLITQCVSLSDETTEPLVVYMEAFNQIDYIIENGKAIAVTEETETFEYNETKVVEAITNALKSKI